MIAEENAAKPPLPWPLREAGKGFHRLPDRIRGFLLNAGPGFADLLDRFEKLELAKRGTHTEFGLTDEGNEEPEEFVFDEIQVPELRQAVQLLITAGKRLRAQQPAQPRQTAEPVQAPTKKPGGTKRGPKPRDHHRIAAIVREHEPWKENLDDICEALDKAHDENEGLRLPRNWRNWPAKPRTWMRALAVNESNVIKSLENSLEEAAKLT